MNNKTTDKVKTPKKPEFRDEPVPLKPKPSPKVDPKPKK